MRDLCDLNVLYDAYRASLKGSSWKREPEKFEHNWLEECVQLKHELETQTYHTSPGIEFEINERGKKRHIHGVRMRDRVVRHAFCDEILGPCLDPYLIPNNAASQKGKGISYARERFERDLHNYYLEHGNTEGCVGFSDLSKFYDNIRHDIAKELIGPLTPEKYHWLLDEFLSNMEIDVSYMSDKEYRTCLEQKFNSLEYYEAIPPELRTGEKMMAKSVNIGDQVSQNIGVFFPHRIDNYVKIVRGVKFYGRYMDDIYFICETKEEAESIIDGIREQAESLGLFINEKKTHISKLTDNYKYLQIKYRMTETGKVVKRINPKSVTRERRKIKAYKRLLDKGVMPYEDIEQAYKSWMGSHAHLMSKQQISNMKNLFKDLFGKEPKWKKLKSHSPTRTKSKQRRTEAATSPIVSQPSLQICPQ